VGIDDEPARGRDRENLVGFTATVDGQPVQVRIDRVAVIEAPYEEGRPLSAQYDTPGRDVTADLARFGLPLTLDVEAVRAALLALPPAVRARVQAAGLAEYYGTEGSATEPLEVWAQWSIVWRYHWTQTFPAGQECGSAMNIRTFRRAGCSTGPPARGIPGLSGRPVLHRPRHLEGHRQGAEEPRGR
jgi:hypothetical protein